MSSARCCPVSVLSVCLLFVSLAGAAYVEPPHSDVADHNRAVAGSLLGMRVPRAGEVPPSNPLRFFSIQPFTFFPSVDGNVSSNRTPELLWGWSYDAQQDFGWQGTLSGCNSSRSRSSLAGVSGFFKLYFEIDGASVALDAPSNPVRVPFSPEQLASSKTLAARLEGTLNLNYYTDDETVVCRQVCYWGSCYIRSSVELSHRYPQYSYSRSSGRLSAPVSVPKLEPALLVPWSRERSVLLPWMKFYWFSNTPFYSLRSFIDGQPLVERVFFSFDRRRSPENVDSVWLVPGSANTSAPDVQFRAYAVSRNGFGYGYALEQAVQSERILGLHRLSFESVDVFGDRNFWSAGIRTHDAARVSLGVSQAEAKIGEPVEASVFLSNAFGTPIPNGRLQLSSPGGSWLLFSGADGFARQRLSFEKGGVQPLTVRFEGSADYAPVSAKGQVFVEAGKPVPPNVFRRYDSLFLLALLVLGVCCAGRRFFGLP